MTILGFEIDLQNATASAFPVAGRIALIIIIALIVQQIASKAITKTLKLATVRHKGEEKEEFEQRIDTISGVFAATVGVIVWGLAGFIILSELGINITPILTGAGIAGLAVGFGAQNLVRDIISGIFILLEDQYSKGDVVKVADISGMVEDINLRRTVLRDLDGIVHYVPNGEIVKASNFTQAYSKVNLNVEVSYETNLDQAIKVIDEVGAKLAKDKEFGPMIKEAPSVLRVDKLGESGVEIKIVGVTKPIKQWDVMGELRKRVKEAFDKEGIEIPYPHRTIVQKAAR
jgi:small conductance mechanosensitive channel